MPTQSLNLLAELEMHHFIAVEAGVHDQSSYYVRIKHVNSDMTLELLFDRQTREFLETDNDLNYFAPNSSKFPPAFFLLGHRGAKRELAYYEVEHLVAERFDQSSNELLDHLDHALAYAGLSEQTRTRYTADQHVEVVKAVAR